LGRFSCWLSTASNLWVRSPVGSDDEKCSIVHPNSAKITSSILRISSLEERLGIWSMRRLRVFAPRQSPCLGIFPGLSV
jgi:hypothetical protein